MINELEKAIEKMNLLSDKYQENYDAGRLLWKQSRYDRNLENEVTKQDQVTNKSLQAWRKSQREVAVLKQKNLTWEVA